MRGFAQALGVAGAGEAGCNVVESLDGFEDGRDGAVGTVVSSVACIFKFVGAARVELLAEVCRDRAVGELRGAGFEFGSS